jgi:hypothetical protein
VPGQLTQRLAQHLDVLGAVCDPALPGRSSTASGFPVPSGPWSTNAQQMRHPQALDRHGRVETAGA